jgi:hypothetical protein
VFVFVFVFRVYLTAFTCKKKKQKEKKNESQSVMRVAGIVIAATALVLLVSVHATASTVVADKKPTVESVSATAFGRTLLDQIKSLKGYENVKSFVNTVKTRIVSEQSAEATAYATFSNMCNSSLSQLNSIVQSRHNDAEKLKGSIKNNTVLADNTEEDIKSNTKLMASAKVGIDRLSRLVNASTALRRQEHQIFKDKLDQAINLQRALASVIPRLTGDMEIVSLTPAKALKEATGQKKKQQSNSQKKASLMEVDAEMGATTEATTGVDAQMDASMHMAHEQMADIDNSKLTSLLQVVAAVSAQGMPIARNETIKHIRKLLGEVQGEFSAYLSAINQREVQDIKFFSQSVSEFKARRTLYQNAHNTHKDALEKLKIQLRIIKKQITEDTDELAVALPSLKNMREQLDTQKKSCSSRAASHSAAVKRFTDELSTVAAIEKLVTEQLETVQKDIKTRELQNQKQQLLINSAKSSNITTQSQLHQKHETFNLTVANSTNSGSSSSAPAFKPNFPSSGLITCSMWLAEFKAHNQQVPAQGVFKLRDEKNKDFKGLCDLSTSGGGWMLAFKQSNFASGQITVNRDLMGHAALLDASFNSTTNGSVLDFGKPSQMLFRTSMAANWFVTPSIEKWTAWKIDQTPRHCLDKTTTKDFTVSPSWDFSKMNLWTNNTSIELMDTYYPTISAVTIGQRVKQQEGQCYAPHCSEFRHGRYNGVCQNNNKGSGDWSIWVR